MYLLIGISGIILFAMGIYLIVSGIRNFSDRYIYARVSDNFDVMLKRVTMQSRIKVACGVLALPLSICLILFVITYISAFVRMNYMGIAYEPCGMPGEPPFDIVLHQDYYNEIVIYDEVYVGS